MKQLVDAILGRRVTLGRTLTLRLTARNDMRGVEQVVRETLKFLDEHARPPEEWRLRFALCLRETVYNAVMHGNQGRRDAEVDVQCDWRPDASRATLTVRDGGRGFDWCAAVAAQDAQGRDRPRGRGLVILAGMSDEVEVHPGEVRFSLSLPRSG